MYAGIYQNPNNARNTDYKHPQRVTMWKSGGLDKYGQPTWSTPVVIKCRLEQGSRVYYTENGREVRGKYYVFTQEGLLREGDMVFVGESSEPTPPSNSLEVKQQRIIPSLLGNVKEYRYAL